MRRLAVVLAALLLVAPVAEGKRKPLRGTVAGGKVGKAPKGWRDKRGWQPAPAAPTPVAPAPDASPTPTPTAGSALPPPNPRSVSVNATEFAFTLSQTMVSAGAVRVQFDNSRAEDPHQLAIDRPDGARWTSPLLESGEVVQQTVDLQPGRHVLLCPLSGHEELGMRAVLTVR